MVTLFGTPVNIIEVLVGFVLGFIAGGTPFRWIKSIVETANFWNSYNMQEIWFVTSTRKNRTLSIRNRSTFRAHHVEVTVDGITHTQGDVTPGESFVVQLHKKPKLEETVIWWKQSGHNTRRSLIWPYYWVRLWRRQSFSEKNAIRNTGTAEHMAPAARRRDI